VKHKWFLLFAVLLFACQTPVEQPAEDPVIVAPEPIVEPEPEPTPTPTPEPVPVPIIVPLPNIRVYNSAWEIVQEGYVDKSRAVTTIQSYADYVEEYNAKNTDDQMFIVEGEAIVPIEEAPPADAYIVDPVTHDIIKQYLDWPRVDLSDRREIWRFQAMADAGVLYVDRVPPPPVVVIDDRPPYEKYALYLIYTADNSIKYEEHLETEAEFLERKAVYETQAYADGGLTYVVSGRLFP